MDEVESASENTSSGFSDLVVVGSSAGGVEALSIFVSTLPTDFPAPIVLAQHLDPNRSSNLDTILQRRTTLTIEVVNSRSLLQAGKIYVVPSNRHVAIYDGHVEVQTQNSNSKRPRPSVDKLLSSAAEVFGEHLIAVILTGSGSDGAAGAVDVKNAGGIIVVQNPQTARYPSMPLALPPTVIDFEADIERIGPLLYDLLTGVHLPQPEGKAEDILRTILEQVNRQASIDFRLYKTSTILRRIGHRMVVTHNSTMSDYLDYIRYYPEEIGELVKAFLINVTQFFRDADAFDFLKSEILPKLIERARARNRSLRFWTAGCATGEETYSLAMLLTDLLGTELPEWSIKIFATDLDEAAINFARRGLYSENLLKGLPVDYSERFFERVDHGYRISKTLRQMIIFGQQDLSRSAPFPRIDLILCRNVLIYFTPQLQAYVLNQFAFSLSPGGYLFLGKAETVRPLQTFYELVNKHWKVYRCTGNALPTAQRPVHHEMNESHPEGRATNNAPRSAGKQQSEQETSLLALEFGQLRRFNELLFRFLPMGVLVIDRAYHVLTANGAARRLLGLRNISNEQDFLHAVRGIPYSEVRNAIDVVFREHNTLTLPEIELDIATGGTGRFLSLSIVPIQTETSTPEQAAISVTDVTEQVQTRRQLEAVQAEQTSLMLELAAANKRMNDVNKELMDANEELQVANEELVLTHEELQASIEEFETTNEELQATNEELETNNEEMQATNEELETTNDELRARAGEMQELSSVLESERMRLSEMVELAPFYVMVLRGPNLLVEAFNPLYAQWLTGRTVRGRALDEIFDAQSGAGVELVRLVSEAYRQNTKSITPRMLMYLSNEEDEQGGRYFVHTIVPTHNTFGKVTGAVIYSMDETEQQTQEAKDDFLLLLSLELRTPLTSMLGNSELLQRSLKELNNAETQKPDVERQEQILDGIIHQAHVLTRLINEVADITRIRSEQFELKKSEHVNIVELVRRVIEQQGVTSDSPIMLETKEKKVEVTCDESRMEQVLNNLLSNAIKYSQVGKPITVGIERNANEVIIAIRDEGHGISEEQKAHIFERFYRAHIEKAEVDGLGMGLYVAHEIIVKHNGRMWLESKTGKGSTFYFALPLPAKE